MVFGGHGQGKGGLVVYTCRLADSYMITPFKNQGLVRPAACTNLLANHHATDRMLQLPPTKAVDFVRENTRLVGPRGKDEKSNMFQSPCCGEQKMPLDLIEIRFLSSHTVTKTSPEVFFFLCFQFSSDMLPNAKQKNNCHLFPLLEKTTTVIMSHFCWR